MLKKRNETHVRHAPSHQRAVLRPFSLSDEAPYFLPYYPSIDMDTGEKVTHVPDWRVENAASSAAEGDNFVARMIGKIT